jgi:hypothetical protein
MEIVHFIYKEHTIDFEPTANDNVMVNATQMAKIFGKDVYDFLKNDNSKNFIAECLKTDNSRFLNVEIMDDLIISKQKSGTWMHRILALKFAAWLDPAFELWVYVTIDRIINHYFREQRDAMIEKITIKAKKEAKRQELLIKYPEMAEYFELDNQEKQAHNKRMYAIKEQFKQLKIEFAPPIYPN